MPLPLRIHPHQDIHNAINRRRGFPGNLQLRFICLEQFSEISSFTLFGNNLRLCHKVYGVPDWSGDKMSILKVVFIYSALEIVVSHKNVINEFIEFENSVATATL